MKQTKIQTILDLATILCVAFLVGVASRLYGQTDMQALEAAVYYSFLFLSSAFLLYYFKRK